MLTVIKGAGDLASGTALRLWRCGIKIVMTELIQPTAIRRAVCFSEAVRLGRTVVEGIAADRASSAAEALEILKNGRIPVLADPAADCIRELRPDVVVDAILAKRNTGTRIGDAPCVIGVGPGFTAGLDCHAVVETKRGHWLGRVLLEGSAAPDTGIPGNVGGYTKERVLRTPRAGVFHPLLDIGARVEAGDIAAAVDGEPVVCGIGGILRGILPDGYTVPEGMKCGDVDPRCERNHCYTVSDKALAVGGGVLEAILSLTRRRI